MSRPGDDDSGAAVRRSRRGGQFGVGSSVPGLQPRCGTGQRPARCEQPAAPALPLALGVSAPGQCTQGSDV